MTLEGNQFFEMRLYKLKPGARAQFAQLFRDKAGPMLARHGIAVVGHGPSLHDEDSYCLLRAYPSLEERGRQLKGFYGSEEWTSTMDAPVMALIESLNTVVVRASPAALAALTSSFAG